MATGSHHKRRQHVRLNQTGKVSTVKQTKVRNRKVVGQAGGPPSDALALAAADSGGDPDAIMFAFQYPDWSSRHFTRQTREPWAEFDIDAENAAAWRDAGYTPEYANEWRSTQSQRPLIPAETALKYIAEGIGPADAGIWDGSVIYTTEEAISWIKAGIEFYLATEWRNTGVRTPEEAQEYIQLGFRRGFDLRALQTMGHESTHRWFEAGVYPSEAFAYRELTEEGFTEKRIGAVIRNKNVSHPDSIISWVRSNVPVNQISTFIHKGYTPSKASSQIRKGQTAKTAPDLKGNEPVPGKAWTDLKDAIINKANKENRTLQTKVEKRSWATVITVTLTDKKNKSDKLTYRMSFSTSGAFQQGRSNIKRKTRAISSKAEYMRLHFS